jgi:hypothetical protein
METWRAVTEMTVWVWVRDERNGGFRKQRVGGGNGGSRVLRISHDDRLYNAEITAEECRSADPFSNGALRLEGESAFGDVDVRYHWTDAEYENLIAVRDEGLFREQVEEIGSELVLRRLRSLTERSGTTAQNEIITEVLAVRYPVGGSQRTYLEMAAERAQAPGIPLSA